MIFKAPAAGHRCTLNDMRTLFAFWMNTSGMILGRMCVVLGAVHSEIHLRHAALISFSNLVKCAL